MATPEADQPLRADARRNRDALLTAARQVFADEGLRAPLDRIARLAGVGRATLYRRFPTREALIAAIFQDNIDALQTVADAAGDAPDAFFVIFDTAAEQQRDNVGFVELFTRSPHDTSPAADTAQLRDLRRLWLDVIREPLRRAQDAGVVRSDVRPEDTGALLLMVGALTAAARGAEMYAVSRSRVMALLRDALDPSGAPRPLS